MVSSWILPHSTRELYNFFKGKSVYELNGEVLDDELRKYWYSCEIRTMSLMQESM
jgi:hypothetical protein